ncbi:MAG: PG0541 family transporter-associated protein [Candidatus Cryptobacteroides sp.]
MKAIFVTYNQAFNDEIVEVLEQNGQRGFTRWNEVLGRGGVDGEPHYGNHAWPVYNQAVLSMLEDDKVASILAGLKEKDEQYPDLGLRAYVWDIENSI